MAHKLPRWTLVSMFLVLGTVATFHIWRGTTATNADDKVSGPIIPPGGPKPIPFDKTADDHSFPSDPFRNRAKPAANFLRTSSENSPPNAEPARLNGAVNDATPLANRQAAETRATDFPPADQTLRQEIPAATGDPFANRNAVGLNANTPNSTRLVSNEVPESNTKPADAASPRPFPGFGGTTAAKPESNFNSGAGGNPFPASPPAWAKGNDAAATEPAPFSAPPVNTGSGTNSAATAPAKSPFGGTPARVNPWGDAPAGLPTTDNSANSNAIKPLRNSPVESGRASPFGAEKPLTGETLGGSAVPAPSGDGSGRPGPKQIEGSQTPQLTLEKLAPKEIQVGKPAVFEIRVKNTGSIVAQGVEIFDELPKGTQLLRTVPTAARGPRNDLVWSVGALKPGEESKVQLEVMPITEGEIGSVATVHFRADASAKTICTKPELTLQVSAPKQVLIGEEASFSIKVSNPGSGVTSGIVLSERVPSGLQHPSGTELEFEVGDLKPGESRTLDLSLKAVTAGRLSNILTARADANLKATDRADLEIVSPGLKVALTGPTKRFLERPAQYTFSVTNPGTAAAKEIELTTYLPKGLKFVKANNSGVYDQKRHCVVWSLEELPATETGAVQMTALPIEEGEQKLRIEGKAQQGLNDSQESTIVVDGVAAVLFEVADLADPIEVGGETTYEVRVTNQGSKAATNIQVVAFLPTELRPLAAEGPTKHSIEGNKVTFEALPRLTPKGDTIFRIRAQALRAGDARVKVQLIADELHQPVTKEESTRIYADE